MITFFSSEFVSRLKKDIRLCCRIGLFYISSGRHHNFLTITVMSGPENKEVLKNAIMGVCMLFKIDLSKVSINFGTHLKEYVIKKEK